MWGFSSIGSHLNMGIGLGFLAEFRGQVTRQNARNLQVQGTCVLQYFFEKAPLTKNVNNIGDRS